jgi:hypothetical protein
MIARAGHQTRLPIVAIAILALLAFASFAALRPTTSAPHEVGTLTPAPPLQQRALQIDTSACGGAYVTGDIVGDSSPSTVYATMCATGSPGR